MQIFTPDEAQSKRTFDGRIKAWRRALHKWDTTTIKHDHTPLVPAVDANGEVLFPLQFVPSAPVTAGVAAAASDQVTMNDNKKSSVEGVLLSGSDTSTAREAVEKVVTTEMDDENEDDEDDVL